MKKEDQAALKKALCTIPETLNIYIFFFFFLVDLSDNLNLKRNYKSIFLKRSRESNEF